MKKIYINGRFLTQHITGVQRYSIEVVKAIDNLVDSGEIDRDKYKFILVSPKKGIIHDLKLKYVKLLKVGFLSGHAWEQFELPFYTRDGLLFCPGNTAPIISLFSSRRKNVVVVHDLSYLYFPNAYSLLFKLLYNFLIPIVLKKADRIITVSESEKKSISNYYSSVINKISVVQNGGLSQEVLINFRNQDNSVTEKKYPYVLYVGSLTKRKNFHGILEAAKYLENEDIKFVIVGSTGKSFSVHEFDIPENIRKKFIFKGQINDISELCKIYKNATCFVFPSFYEASPFPPIEAMSFGVPVIASSIPSLIERCGDAAIYCDPENPEDIANQIKKIINNDVLREEYKKKSLKQAEKFTWEICAKKTFEILLEEL